MHLKDLWQIAVFGQKRLLNVNTLDMTSVNGAEYYSESASGIQDLSGELSHG